MMKGEFFAMPPKPKQAPKKAFKKVMIDSKTLADMLPQDDLSHATAIDAFGFGLSVKRDPDEETDQMWVDFCDRGELGWGVFGGVVKPCDDVCLWWWWWGVLLLIGALKTCSAIDLYSS